MQSPTPAAILHPPSSILCFLISILYPLSAILVAGHASELPAHVVTVPVVGARSLALHPTQRILYVGVAGRTNGMGVITFQFDESGKLIAESRRRHADGIVEGGAVSADAAYAISQIVFDPVRPEVYLNASPEKMRLFRAQTNTALIVALALDENGLPAGKVDELRPGMRKTPFGRIECDAKGRYVYLGQDHGPIALWPVGETELVANLKAQPLPAPRRRMPAPRKARRVQNDLVVSPRIDIAGWTWVGEWGRGYATGRGTLKVVFAFGEDGRTCVFAQPIAMQNPRAGTPQVSEKHRKLYVPQARGEQLGIYPLTREGRLTSVPRFVHVGPARFICVDDRNGRFYALPARGAVSMYALDSEGYPVGEPKRFELGAGVVNGVALSRNGTLYVACSAPPGGTL